MLTDQQRTALAFPCYLAEETVHPRFGLSTRQGTLVVTINSGYE